MVRRDGLEVAEPAIVLAAGAHGQERLRQYLGALAKYLRQVQVEHFAKVLEIPADRRDIWVRLPAHSFRTERRGGPLPDVPEITVEVVPELHPRSDSRV